MAVSITNFELLQEAAEKILFDLPSEKRLSHSLTDSQRNHQLDLYHIEMEMQNVNLRNTLNAYEQQINHYEELFNLTPFGFFKINQQGLIVNVNDVGATLLGIKKDFLKNKLFARYVFSDYCLSYAGHQKRAFDTLELQTAKLKILRKNGSIFFAKLYTRPVVDSFTQEKFLLNFIFDETEAEKNEKIKKQETDPKRFFEKNISSVVAHELNHPLSVITNYLYGCISRLSAGEMDVNEIVDALQKAAQQAHRASEIILKMKNFTCQNNLVFELADINLILKSAIELLKSEQFNFPLNITFRPRKNIPLIAVDKSHILQVIINLGRNAIEAMQDAKIASPKLVFHVTQISVDVIEISIIDNGPGISEDAFYQIFNPYFTTKSYGIGLGLAISHAIVKAHGGKLITEKLASGGACFKFTLFTDAKLLLNS